MLSKLVIATPFLAAMALAQAAPSCSTDGGRGQAPFDNAYGTSYTTGNNWYVCYNNPTDDDSVVPDSGWITDIRAMMETMYYAPNPTCCVDCTTSGAARGCTGTPGFTDADNCPINGSDNRPNFSDADINTWMTLLQEMLDQGISMSRGEGILFAADAENGTLLSGTYAYTSSNC